MQYRSLVLVGALIVSSFFATGAQGQATWYVDDDAPLAGDGATWNTAFKHLQDALGIASACDEVRIAQGTYRPSHRINPSDPRTATFQLINGVAVKGGYAGLSNPADPDERDVVFYKTYLTGDLDGDDGPDWANHSNNCYHVFYHPEGHNLDETAILDGVTITAGYAEKRFSQDNGGGMYNSGSHPTISDCTFTKNFALYGGGIRNNYSSPTVTNCRFSENIGSYNGGGIFSVDSHPTVINCTFSGNWAGGGGGMYNGPYARPTVTKCTFSNNQSGAGGGMCNKDSHPTVINCTFSGNSAVEVGGGMYNRYSSPIVSNCTFSGNSAVEVGGGMYNRYSSPIVSNCTFSENSTEDYGGGMYNNDSDPTVANCTFCGNRAESGAAIACDSVWQQYPSAIELMNCILWGGDDRVWNNDDSTITITFSNIQGGWPDDDCPVEHPDCNTDADPLFVPGPVGCYYLSQTAAGQSVDSPCVDTGSDTAENLALDALTTRWDEGTDTGIVDMGYHYPVTGQPLIMGDYNRDLDVDLADFAAMQNCFTWEGRTNLNPCCRIFDFEPDNDVDLGDYAAFLLAFNP